MSGDLVLNSVCESCGAKSNLYGSNCKHTTICLPCGKHLAQTKAVCSTCRSPVTKLIREYNVRATNISDKSFSIGTFKDGLPECLKKSSAKFFMHKEGLKGPKLTDALRAKHKKKPWIIEDESGEQMYEGRLEGSQQGAYYILMIRERDFFAIPVDEWYTFNKVVKYKQLSLEEAEEKMKKRKKTAEGFSRWMMKIANSGGASAKDGKLEELEGGARSGPKKGNDEGNDNVLSDREEENEDEEGERKARLGLNKRVGDENEEEVKGGDCDADADDDTGKGDDWEHEEIFTDDDEAVGSDAEDEDEDESDSEASVLPEIKQDGDECNEEEGDDLSISGKELKKLLERQSRIDDDNGGRDVDGEKHVTIAKAMTGPASISSMPQTTKSGRAKRKSDNEDLKPTEASPTKKLKADMQSIKTNSVRDEVTSTSKSVSTSGKHTLPASNKATFGQTEAPVTEEELLNFLREKAPITIQSIAATFRPRIKTQEDKTAFAQALKKISYLEKINGVNHLVLRNI